MKKVLFLILAIILLIGLVPTQAFATDKEHNYDNGICTNCGVTHPNLSNYNGKIISILGDSISTFAGYIPVADGFNLDHEVWYPNDNLLTDVNETWWMQIINNLNMKLGINDSWESTEVYNYIDEEVNSTFDGTKACMASLTRIQNLGSNGTPDVIFFFGGTNDITQSRPLGTFNPDTAPTEVDLISVKWDTVADAYIDAIMRMQYYYPDAQIVSILPYYRHSQGTAKVNKYNNLFATICEYYGVFCVDLRNCGISRENIPDGTHPNADGMDYITSAVFDVLMSDCHIVAGEHIVHSVTHNLNYAKSTLSYYKGISHGKSFTTTITGNDVTVTVTMNGTNITSDCYTNGVISIDHVIGDLVITAKGLPEIYEEYLQELPTNFCCGINLWSTLEPINLYYSSSDWELNTPGLAHSITFLVSAGDQIWATSFQESALNSYVPNNIILTWFYEYKVTKTVSFEEAYAEFTQIGYLTVPEGAVAVNVVMLNGNEDHKVYILNREHTYENATCTSCGDYIGPLLIIQPKNIHTNNEKIAKTSVVAYGDDLTYQWYYKNVGSTRFHLSSNTGKSYSTIMSAKSHGRQIYCVITDKYGNSVQTDTVTLSANVFIKTQPKNIHTNNEKIAKTSVTAYGDDLTYQWYYKNVGSTRFRLSSNTGKSYSTIMSAKSHGRQIYCVITDKYGNSVQTDTVTLSANVFIKTQPKNMRTDNGKTVKTSVTAYGDDLTYQWYYKNVGSTRFRLSSNTGKSYSTIMSAKSHGRQIYCVITDKYGNQVTTNVVTLTR